MPGGQQIDITDQPVTTAREAQPARRADGWMWVLEEQQEMVRGKSKESKQLLYFYDENKDIMTEKRDTIFVYFQNNSAYCSVVVCTCKDAHICTRGFSISQIHLLCLWL